jgi:hypothetical protein
MKQERFSNKAILHLFGTEVELFRIPFNDAKYTESPLVCQ